MTNPFRTTKRAARAFRAGLAVSLVLHATLVIMLALRVESVDREPSGIRVAASFVARSPEDRTVSAVRLVRDSSEVTGPMVSSRLNEMVAEQKKRTSEQQLKQLDQAASRLERFSSRESLDELSEHFQSWLGYAPRAAQPAAALAPGKFDLESAQLHDVRRQAVGPNRWRYVTVLVDAQGRTREVEMPESEGHKVYLLMRRFESSPLLEKLYRQIVMPLLDQLIRAAETPIQPAAPSLEPHG
jgi:hypothetical protein